MPPMLIDNAHHQHHHARVHPAAATSYCLNGNAAHGGWVDKRTAAHDFLPPGTRIHIVGKQAGPGGVRNYVVRDTGPALMDGHFDLWAPSCSMSVNFGRRAIKWKLGWRRR